MSRGCHPRSDVLRCVVPLAMEWLKSVHFYRKVPRDLTEATLAGGTISLISSIVMAYLFISNFSAPVLVGSSTCIARPARRVLAEAGRGSGLPEPPSGVGPRSPEMQPAGASA